MTLIGMLTSLMNINFPLSSDGTIFISHHYGTDATIDQGRKVDNSINSSIRDCLPWSSKLYNVTCYHISCQFQDWTSEAYTLWALLVCYMYKHSGRDPHSKIFEYFKWCTTLGTTTYPISTALLILSYLRRQAWSTFSRFSQLDRIRWLLL